MNKLFVAIMALIICAGTINAQQPARPLPNKLDDFIMKGEAAENITTEIIECSPNSNVYTKINIHRNYGVPRFGIITDCSGRTLDTVWYIPDTIVRRQGGGIVSPWLKDTSLTVWWRGGLFTVQIMDVLTGNVVLDSNCVGQPPSEFNPRKDTISPDFIIETIDAAAPPKSTNLGLTINYNHIPNGLYWIYIISDNKVQYMETIRKGI